MLIQVLFAPMSKVALISTPDGKLYAFSYGDLREEHSPQMFNLHLDNFCYEREMEDEYPFLMVEQELKNDTLRIKLVEYLIDMTNTVFNEEIKKTLASAASNIVHEHPDMIIYARKIMLECKLPEKAEINDEIIATLSQPLQDLFREVVAKWRSSLSV